MSITSEALDCLVSREWLRCWYTDNRGVTVVLKDGSEVRMRLEAAIGNGIRRVTFRLENGDGLTVVFRTNRLLSLLYETKIDWDDPMMEAWGAS